MQILRDSVHGSTRLLLLYMSNPTNEKITYFLYARKSSDGEDRQVQSIDDQLKVLKELAVRLNLEIKEIFTESKSAKKPYNRPVFTEMVKRIERGEAQGILCWKLNRVARNPVDGGAIIWMLQNSVIKHIKTADGNFYPTDNILLISVEFGIANQYIIDLRKDCRRGMEGKAERGWLPAMPPVGYFNNKEDKTIAEDTERFNLVRRMWDMLLSGNYTPPQIQHTANRQWGFRTRRYKKEGDRPLARCTIYKMFNNIFYTGLFEWGGKVYNGNHKPMITIEEFDRAQAILGKNGKPRAKTHQFAYTGMIRCGECGAMVTASEKQKMVKATNTLTMYVYYHCTKRKTGVPCHGQKPITLNELEIQIVATIERFTILPEFAAFAVEYLRGNYQREVDGLLKIKEARENAIQSAERELTNLTRMRYREQIDETAFISERGLLQLQIIKLKKQLKETKDCSAQWVDLTERAFRFAAYAKAHFQNGTLQEKKETLAALGWNYTLKDKILLIDIVEWLKLIELRCPLLMAEFKALELIESPYYERRNELLASLRLSLCTIVEEVRTFFERLDNPNIYIPTIEVSITETEKGKPE